MGRGCYISSSSEQIIQIVPTVGFFPSQTRKHSLEIILCVCVCVMFTKACRHWSLFWNPPTRTLTLNIHFNIVTPSPNRFPPLKFFDLNVSHILLAFYSFLSPIIVLDVIIPIELAEWHNIMYFSLTSHRPSRCQNCRRKKRTYLNNVFK